MLRFLYISLYIPVRILKTMTNNYPYYVPVIIDAGQMRKVLANKKFRSAMDAHKALCRHYEHLKKFSPNVSISTFQHAILEYTGEYQCRIVLVITKGITNTIVTPQIL